MRGSAHLGVALEPLAERHLDQTARLWGDPAVIRYTNMEKPCTREEAAERLRLLLDSQRTLPEPVIFAVLQAGRFCGAAGSPPVDADQGIFGLFYQLLPETWGQGVGRAAAEQVLEALRSWAPQAVVLADAAAENTASIRILEGMGFCRTAIRPRAARRGGTAWDIWEYELHCGRQEEECP